jgi:hypothetical protein
LVSSSRWLASYATGSNHLLFPNWIVGLILGTINPLTISRSANNQWVCYVW